MGLEVQPRYYFLPISRSCLPGCRFCGRLGCFNSRDRDADGILRALKRAQGAGFPGILFSSALLESPFRDWALSECRTRGLLPLVRLDWNLSDRLASLGPMDLGLNFLFDGTERPDASVLDEAIRRFRSVHLTLSPAYGADLPAFVGALPPSAREKLYFHFSPFTLADGDSQPITVVHRRLAQLRRAFPDLAIRPPLGHEVWDPRIDPELGLEPDLEPLFRHRISTAAPAVSVVIPSYNSGATLGNVLKHLFRQDLPRSEYEIIVVDDGSTDSTSEAVRSIVAPEAGKINFTYLYFPRTARRTMGDGAFRAGIARNCGVKHATGRLLSFIDADIIVPQGFLRDLIAAHERWDVVQCVRRHLKDRSKNEAISYDEVDPNKESYVLEPSYWGPFFETRDWSAIPYFWKYTCTYGLSLPAELFRRIGGFKRTFVYYGFEDTELGYRLAREGARFHLSPIVTYHLNPGIERSEYRHSQIQREMLLSKTAKVFYLNSLDPRIFEHFRTYMSGDSFIVHVCRRIKRALKRAPGASVAQPIGGFDAIRVGTRLQ